MHCFNILLHGRLNWTESATECQADPARPAGFYSHRFVLASNSESAAQKAKDRVARNFDRKTGWLRDGKVELALEVEEVSQASLIKCLWPANQGHVFYEHD